MNTRHGIRTMPTALFVLLVGTVSMFWLPLMVQAQTPTWSQPHVLTPDLDTLAIRPLLAVDPWGRLHAIWTEGEQSGTQARLHSIVYAYRDHAGWSEPVDVLAASPGNSMSDLKGFAATPSGLLAVAWSEAGQVWVATAPAEAASVVRNWQSGAVDAGANPHLLVSPEGNWILAYWSDASTLVVRRSSDDGLTWSEETRVWQASAGSVGSNVVGLVARDGALHLVWAENVERRDWSAEAIWHARLDPTTGNLVVREVARSARLDEPTLDAPIIAECPDGSLHIVWNNGVGSRTGRFHQWWSSSSQAWSGVTPLFPGLSGQTGKPALVCDNTGRVHLVTAARGDERSDSVSGLRYATWYQGSWSPYETLWGGAYSGERPFMAVVGGNELHLVWHFFYLDGQRVHLVAHSYRSIAADSIEPAATYAEIVRGPAVVASGPFHEPTATVAARSLEVPQGSAALAEYSDRPQLPGYGWGVVIGGISSFVVLALALGTTLARRSRQ